MSGPLPQAPRQAYRVRLRGRNLVAQDPVHSDQAVRLGFWATCLVEASSEREAADVAFGQLYADEELRSVVRNDPDHPPAVDVEEVEELDGLPCNPAARLTRYEWFTDAAPSLKL